MAMTEIKRRNGYYMLPNGRQEPSVSTILSCAGNPNGLIQWAAKQGAIGAAMEATRKGSITIEEACEYGVAALKTESSRVQDFGTRVHLGIECHLKQMDLDVSAWSPAEIEAVKTFVSFYNDIGFDPHVIEASLYSVTHGYGGRCDLIADLSHEQVKRLEPYLTRSSDAPCPGRNVADFKTGTLYPTKVAAQLAAYKIAYEETSDTSIQGGLIIGIHRDQPSKIVVHAFSQDTLNDAFVNGFIPAQQVWKYWEAPKWWSKQGEDK